MIKNILSLFILLIVLFGFISCPDDPINEGKNIEVTLNNVTANGSTIETTTQLTLTFSEAIANFSANDITITGVTDVIKGTLTNSGAIYTLPISGFIQGGTLSVAVSKTGYAISGSPKNVSIYITPVGWQVYNSDKTTPYTGGDLDFYIQGETNATKTIAATVRNGRMTLNYILLPTGLSYSPDIPSATEKTPGDLARVEIILEPITDNTKVLELMRISNNVNDKTRAQMFYFNKNGSYKIIQTYNIVQGWNFLYQGASATPDRFLIDNFSGYSWVWVIRDK